MIRLSFFIDFWGRNNYTPFGNKTKYLIPKSDLTILKRLNIRNKAKILLYLKPGIKRYGQASYGYLVDKSMLTINKNIATFDKTKHGDEFFILKRIFKNGGQTSIVAGTEIKDKYFLLIETQEEAAKEWWNNDSQRGNTYAQLYSLLKGNNTINYLGARKKLINAIDSSLRIKNYVKAVNALRAIPQDTVEYYNLDNFYNQDLVTRVSFFDDLDSIHHTYEQYRSPSTTASPNQKFVVNGDAINTVFEIAKNEKMLMINENHYDYRHRLFVYLLLDKLYKIGYRNLCLEDLKRKADNKYVNKEDGFYISEPFMATLIRKAKEIGFNVYGYDANLPTIPERELGQAKNLYNLYSKDPNHKWVVLAGYSHINKKYFSGESKSALQNFTAIAGFAPYSINQSALSDITDQRYTVPGAAVGYFAADTSSFIYKEGQADLYIINNIKNHPFEKPFSSIQSHLQKYTLDILRGANAEENLSVYIKKEFDELHDAAIPVYIRMAKKDVPKVLYLPANDYIGVTVNLEGSETGHFTVIRGNALIQKVNEND
jgi:hypothetical protein